MAKRKIPCNYCKGEVLATQNGKSTSSQALFPRMQNFLSAIGDVMSSLAGGPKSVSRKEALGGKCEACGGSGQIEDPTDTSEADKRVSDYFKSNAQKITELEQKLENSPGGSMLERIAGAKVTIVGRTLNTAPSVTVHKGKARPPTQNKLGKATPVTTSTADESNVVTGNNVPANTGGGLYYIQCGNKFKLTAGAQGIELTSHGPINIDGSQIRFSGAEVTLGSKSGPTLIEGDHLQINGKSIALTPSGKAGEVVIQGSASCSGNLRAGGAYVENMYCASMTMPSSQTSSKVAAGTTDYITGPAKWGGMTGDYGKLATQNLIKWATDSTTDINLAGSMGPINPRNMLKTADNIASLIKSLIPLELTFTGYIPPGLCVVVGSGGVSTNPAPVPIFNFPHTHGLPDSPHTHDMTVPAINCDGFQNADAVRQAAVAANINSPIPATATQEGNPIQNIIGALGTARATGTALVQDLFA